MDPRTLALYAFGWSAAGALAGVLVPASTTAHPLPLVLGATVGAVCTSLVGWLVLARRHWPTRAHQR